MPQSRNRPGHPYQKPADIPQSQRTKGRIAMAVLFGFFGLILTFFGTQNIIILILVAAAAATVGYFTGKSMEKQAKNKS